VATLYLGIADDVESDNVFNVAGTLFLWVSIPALGATSYLPSLMLERPLFIRERSDGLYRPITYLMSKLFDELFISIFISLAFAAVIFWSVQLQVRLSRLASIVAVAAVVQIDV
jgi:hypothetical protein